MNPLILYTVSDQEISNKGFKSRLDLAQKYNKAKQLSNENLLLLTELSKIYTDKQIRHYLSTINHPTLKQQLTILV